MKLRFKRRIAWVLLVFFPQLVLGGTQAEYERLMLSQMNALLKIRYAFLGRDFSSLAAVMSLKMQQRRLRMFETKTKLLSTQEGLAGTRKPDMKLLREAALLKRDAENLVEEVQWDKTTFARLNHLRQEQCDPVWVKKFAKEYDVASSVQIKQTLVDLKDAIAKVIQSGAPPSGVGLQLTLPVGGSGPVGANVWPNGQQPGGGSSDWQTAFVTSLAGLAAWGGAALQAAQAGVALGSVVPGVGSVIGAVVGALIGFLFVGLFCKDPRVIMTEKLQEESQAVIGALESLRGETKVTELLSKNCKESFQEPEFEKIFTMVKDNMIELPSVIQSDYEIIQKTAEQIEGNYKQALDALLRDYIPAFTKNFNDEFEAYLKAIDQRNAESKTFCDAKLTSPVAVLIDTKATPAKRMEAEAQLWDLFIDGDARFAEGSGFSFLSSSDTASSSSLTVYWNGVTKTVIEQLEGRP